MTRQSERSAAEVYEEMSEAEYRLRVTLEAGEPSAERRADFWFSGLLAAYLNVHRRSGAAAVKAEDLIPDWEWRNRSDRDEQSQAQKATNQLLAWAKAMSGKAKGKAAKAVAPVKKKRR